MIQTEEIRTLQRELAAAGGLERVRLQAELAVLLALRNLQEAEAVLAEAETAFENFHDGKEAGSALYVRTQAALLRARGWRREMNFKLVEAGIDFRAASELLEDGKEKIRVLLDLARTLRNSSQIPLARTALQQVSALLDQDGDRQFRITLCCELALCNHYSGEPLDAQDHLRHARELFEDGSTNEAEQIGMLQVLGGVATNLGNFSEAVDYFDRVIPRLRAGGHSAELLVALHGLRKCLLALNRFRRALDAAEESLALARRTGMKFVEANTLKFISDLHLQFGELDRANAAAEEALHLMRELGHEQDILSVTVKLGRLGMLCGADERGMLLLNAAGAQLRGMSFNLRIFDVFGPMIEYTPDSISLEELEALLRQGLERAYLPGMTFPVRIPLLLGRIHERRRELDQAREQYQSALALSRQFESTCLQAAALTHLGRIETRLERYDEARRHLRSALTVAADCADWTVRRQVHDALCELFAQSGEWRPALQQHREAFDLEQSVLLQRMPQRLQRLQTDNNVEKLERRRDKLKIQVREADESLGRLQSAHAAGKTTVAEGEERLRTLHSLLRRAARGSSAADALDQARALLPADAARPGNEPDESPDGDAGFIAFLKQRFNALTPQELKVCDLLRLNHGSKSLARLMNVSPRAVESYRYRIRRKIGVDSGVDLAACISAVYNEYSAQ